MEVDRCIDLNFVKNIPSRTLWMAGGFASLKLTGKFYESDAASRIFCHFYGIKKCRIELPVLNEAEIESWCSKKICVEGDAPIEVTIVDCKPDVHDADAQVRQNS